MGRLWMVLDEETVPDGENPAREAPADPLLAELEQLYRHYAEAYTASPEGSPAALYLKGRVEATGAVWQRLRDRASGATSARGRVPAPPHHALVCAAVAWVELSSPTAIEEEELAPRTITVKFGTISVRELQQYRDPEAALVHKLVQQIQSTRPTLCTFNGRSFDLPVLAARAARHGVPFPWFYERDSRYRFGTGCHLDLCDDAAAFGAATYSGLGAAAKAIGLPGKIGDISGANVAEAIAAGRILDVESYCLADTVQAVGLLLRRLYSSGELSHVEYQQGAAALLVAMRADARLEGLLPFVDVRRFLAASDPLELRPVPTLDEIQQGAAARLVAMRADARLEGLLPFVDVQRFLAASDPLELRPVPTLDEIADESRESESAEAAS